MQVGDEERDDREDEVAPHSGRPPAHGHGDGRDEEELAGHEVVGAQVGGTDDVAEAGDQRHGEQEIGKADLHEHLRVRVDVLVRH